MNPTKIIDNLYTLPKSNWIKNVDDEDINPVSIQRALGMNSQALPAVVELEKYSIKASKKAYLYLAWALVPKYNKPPFIKYIKKNETEELYSPILKKIQKILTLSDNDLKHEKRFFIHTLEKDKSLWFKKLGFDKDIWLQHGLSFDDMSSGGKRQGKQGLEMFGL